MVRHMISNLMSLKQIEMITLKRVSYRNYLTFIVEINLCIM